MTTFVLKKESDRAKAIEFLKELPLHLPQEVTIKPHDPKRSNQANSLAHVWAGIIANHFDGYSRDEIYQILKAKFIGVREVNVMGVNMVLPKESKNLNKSEYSDFLRCIQGFAIDNSIALPVYQEDSYA